MARHSVTFSYTGGLQTQVIPATYAGGFQFDVAGGQGGGTHFGVQGGLGGRVTGSWAVAVADTINVYVGGQGSPGLANTAAAGAYGYHAGGASGAGVGATSYAGGGGGGSSAVLDGAAFIAEAGGGGGQGGYGLHVGAAAGGAGGGGGASGGNGATGSGSNDCGGAGATGGPGGGAGGAGCVGTGGNNGSNGAAQSAGVGGAGGGGYVSNNFCGGGGGGGGGTTGGGGGGGAGSNGNGGNGGGGGGGASTAAVAAGAAFNDAYEGGAGYATLSWQVAPTATATAPTGTVTATSTPTITGTYTSADGAAQQAYQIIVYTVPGGGIPAGFVPATGHYTADGGTPLPQLWNSGIVFASGPGVSVPAGVLLPNGNLIAYVAFEDSAGADSLWSAWASTTWTQAVPGPAAPAVALAPSPSTARVNVTITPNDNMLSAGDSDLETGLGDWATVAGTGNCTVAQTTAQAQHGTHALSMTATALGTMTATTGPGATGRPCVAGQSYVGMASMRSAVTARSVQVALAWFGSGGGLISTSTGSAVNDTTTGWTQATVTATAPAGAVTMALRVIVVSAAAAEVHYVDEAAIFVNQGAVPAWVLGGVFPSYYTIQRSLDGGNTWTTCQGGSAYTAPAGPVVFADHGAPREQTVTYRVLPVNVTSGVSFLGTYSANQATYLSSDGNDWLMSAGNPALDTQITYQGPNLGALSHEDQQVYYPEGRQDAVLFHGTIHYEQFVNGMGSNLLTFAFPNDAAWNNFKAIRALQQPVLLKTVYGDTAREQFWVVLAADGGTTRYGGGDKTLPGTGRTSQIRTVQIGAYVVNEPT